MTILLKNQALQNAYQKVKSKDPDQHEFLQAVFEIMSSLEPLMTAEPEYMNVLETFFEPEKVFSFKVTWTDDSGKHHVNRGFRVQFSSAIGPYKGGLRFHPTVDLSIMKFLACDQCIKNSLTGLTMGGAKGGSDFDPKGKSDNEIKSFCQSFMTSLWKYIGSETDVPAGDIGVGGKEIGYMFGQYKKLANVFDGTLTGKGATWGGSKLRPEATGYGAVFFLKALVNFQGESITDMKCTVSGSGNVSQFAAVKLIQLGAKVLTMSDSSGYIYKSEGFTMSDVHKIMHLKNVQKGRIFDVCKAIENVTFFENKKPWEVACTAAFPCATQNEIEDEDAHQLANNGCKYVVEGANMPTTIKAINVFNDKKVVVCPGIAANAGGVAVSGYEMAQNATLTYWTAEQVEEKLENLMQNIFKNSQEASEKYTGEKLNLVAGAHIAGFKKLAQAISEQGML